MWIKRFSRAVGVVLICFNTLVAFEFSWPEIQAKLEKPLPDWMQLQIHEDLEPFYQKGVTSKDIEMTIQNVYSIPSGRQAGFVRFHIHCNKITVTSPSESLSDVRIAHVVEVLEEMAKYLVLPDVDFLAALWDSYDNPLHLEKTSCPVFTICKMKGNSCGVLFPEFRFFSYRSRLFADVCQASERYRWEGKIPKALWRGMTSGFNYTLYSWDLKPRSRLVLFAKEYPELVDAAFTTAYCIQNDVEQWMKYYNLFDSWSYPTEFVRYKYLVSIDGNTFASNLWWQLLSNCTVMKNESKYIEWFYKGVSPHVHYLPYALDLSDFKEKLIWLNLHDQEAKRIAEAGRAFAQEHLSNESLVVYFYRLLQAYYSLQRPKDVE